MAAKLTLSIDKNIIEAAKQYARNSNTSLSNLIENYLVSVTVNGKHQKNDISPLVKSLSGVLKSGKRIDLKKQYANHLTSKYK